MWHYVLLAFVLMNMENYMNKVFKKIRYEGTAHQTKTVVKTRDLGAFVPGRFRSAYKNN